MFSNNLLMAAAGGGDAGYVIEGSGLLNDDDSAYMTRTNTTPTDADQFMVNAWIKLGNVGLGGVKPILCWYSAAGTQGWIGFTATTYQLQLYEIASSVEQCQYTFNPPIWRDPASWYNFHVECDSTASAGSRVRAWVNGAELTSPTISVEKTLNQDWNQNTSGRPIFIGKLAAVYFDGYISQHCFVDGSVDGGPSNFIEQDNQGYWKPKDVTGLTFGTNGFLLEGGTNVANGVDSSITSTTAVTINHEATSTNTANSTTDYTGLFDGIAIGTAAGDRIVQVCVDSSRSSAGARTVSTMTIGGIAAKLIKRSTTANGDALEIWAAEVPTGTTADIDVDMSASMDNMQLNVWSITGADFDSYFTISDTGTTLSQSTLMPLNSAFIGATFNVGNSGCTWTGATEEYDGNIEDGNDASGAYNTSGPNVVTTVTATMASAHAADSMAGVVWFPADGPLNHFTPSGTPTATNDSPTNDADNDYGNYCRIDPNAIHVASTTNGNKSATSTATDRGLGFGTLPFDSEDAIGFYFEIVPKTSAGSTIGAFALGACTADVISIAATRPTDSNAASWIFHGDGGINHTAYITNGAWDSQANGTGALNDTFQFVYKNGSCYFGINDTWYDSSDGSFGNAGSAFDSITGMLYPMLSHGSASVCTWDLLTADEDFNMTKPTGLKNIGTHTMPDPAIPDPTKHHQVELVSHDGTSTNVTCNWDMDVYDTLIITKNRDSAEAWYVSNAIDGYNKYDSWDNNAIGVTTDANVHAVSGATLTLGSTLSNDAYVVEFHKAGLVASRDTTNSDGSITGAGDSLIISANTTSGFSMLTFTGGGIADTVGHGLTQAPEFIITHSDNGGDQHAVYHVGVASDAETDYLALDTNAAAVDTDMWNDTAPTASVYSIGTSTYASRSGATFTTFLWHGVEGYSAFGPYEGNSSSDGPMLNAGFLPTSSLLKRIDSSESWYSHDIVRSPYNETLALLYVDGTNAEVTTTANQIDMNSNGVKIRASNNGINASHTLIYSMWGGRPIQGPAPSTSTSQGRAR